MSSIVDLIILASSSKNSERCIAGIDRKSGQWIRPVGLRGQGEVPFELRNIDGKEPEILDVVRMELDDSAETYGFQTENRAIVGSPWELVDRATADEILSYCCREEYVFYDEGTEIRHAELKEDESRSSSLQLWKVDDFSCFPDRNIFGKQRWKGRFSTPSGHIFALTIKDVEFEAKLNNGHECLQECMLLTSLGAPFRSQFRSEDYCWKLIATVIEL